MEYRRCRQTQDASTRKIGRGPTGRERVTHPVPLGTRQKLTVTPGLEENHIGRQAGGNAAVVRQVHGICRYTADSGGPVLVGPVQVSHSASLNDHNNSVIYAFQLMMSQVHAGEVLSLQSSLS